jgi:hypothetical protein
MAEHMSYTKSFAVSILFLVTAGFPGFAQDIPPTTSLVYPGSDGRLVYVSDSLGNTIPDFSHAGYKGGGVAIPIVPVRRTVWPMPGDNSVKIQEAIDEVSTLPADASGFRGAILLKMGTYLLEKPIFIRSSGVVLRGEGMSDVGTILVGRISAEGQSPSYRQSSLINIAGSKGITLLEDSKQVITDNYVAVGARTFNVKAGKGFKVGDKVLVRRVGNQEWIKAIGQDTLTVGRNRWRPFNINYDRTITAIKENSITVDAPISPRSRRAGAEGSLLSLLTTESSRWV